MKIIFHVNLQDHSSLTLALSKQGGSADGCAQVARTVTLLATHLRTSSPRQQPTLTAAHPDSRPIWQQPTLTASHPGSSPP
eukprot:353459-Chlamydomonas_euryale.AAC.8